MKHYQTPSMKFFMTGEDAICVSGDVDMSLLWGSTFGNDNTGLGGES